jgi:hypothetical protein
VAESAGAPGQMAGALRTGVNVLSLNQTVTFVRYTKLVLPLDGYVFWVRSELLSTSALFNVSTYNSAQGNQPRRATSIAPSFTAPGSLHIATANQQDPDESFSVNRVVFTSEVEVNDLNDVSPTTMFIATFGDFKFAFSQRGSFYRQAGLYHYSGDAVYPVMEPQIIDSVAGFDSASQVVSNSIPIWLALQQPGLPIYPAYLVPDNIRPPYIAVDIQSTRALQAAPVIDRTGSHWQLVADRVKLSIYGLRNFNALDFHDYLFARSLADDTFGVMDMPVMVDEKRAQVELSALAQKKSFSIEISYYQARMNALARQLILTAIPAFYVAN